MQSIKLFFDNGAIRRLGLGNDFLKDSNDCFQRLKTRLLSVLGIAPFGSENFSLHYIDDEGDKITISSDIELIEAFAHYPTLLKLYVTANSQVSLEEQDRNEKKALETQLAEHCLLIGRLQEELNEIHQTLALKETQARDSLREHNQTLDELKEWKCRCEEFAIHKEQLQHEYQQSTSLLEQEVAEKQEEICRLKATLDQFSDSIDEFQLQLENERNKRSEMERTFNEEIAKIQLHSETQRLSLKAEIEELQNEKESFFEEKRQFEEAKKNFTAPKNVAEDPKLSTRWKHQTVTIREMGFPVDSNVISLLDRFQGDVSRVVEQLMSP